MRIFVILLIKGADVGVFVVQTGENETAVLFGKPEVVGEKPVPVPLCPPQISHELTWV
jgi:hypothetical protein